MARARRELHVLHVVSPASVGGLETVVANLTTGLVESGIKVSLLTALDGADVLPAVFHELGSVDVVPVPGESLRPDREFSAVSSLLPSADLIHTHGYRPDIVQGALPRSVPTVSTVHGFTGGSWVMRAYEQLQLRALRDFSAVVSVSEPLAGRLEAGGVPPSRIETIPNAIREPSFLAKEKAKAALGIAGSPFVFGWVGRMTPEKNPHLAIEAFLQASPEMPGAELVMIGGGPLMDGLRSEQPAQVRFLGEIEGAGQYMRGLDALILSSDTEGTPIVLIEAMWAGTPIVATAVGGIPWLLSRQEADLVTPGSRSALAAALLNQFVHPKTTEKKAARALCRAQSRNDFGAWVARYRGVYERVTPYTAAAGGGS